MMPSLQCGLGSSLSGVNALGVDSFEGHGLALVDEVISLFVHELKRQRSRKQT
jgi:hypothetical protein